MTGGLTDPSPVTNRNGSAPNNSSPNQAPLRPRPQSAAANRYPSNHQRSRQQSAPAYFPNNSNTNPSNQDLSQLLSRLANVNRRRTTHQGRIIVRTADDGKYIMLDDSTVWKSEDESTSSGWSEGTEVIIARDKMTNLEEGESVDVEEMTQLSGYKYVGDSTVSGAFEGADFDKAVKLDNGMVFLFQTFGYTYTYRPSALIFQYGNSSMYELLIDDEAYSVKRIR